MLLEDLIIKAEEGNLQAQFELGARYAEGRGVPRDTRMAVRWLGRCLLGQAHRLTPSYIEEFNSQIVQGRADIIRQSKGNEPIPDMVVQHVRCPKCKCSLSNDYVRTGNNPGIYSNSYDVISYALYLCYELDSSNLPKCSRCKVVGYRHMIQYQTWNREENHDFVVRCYMEYGMPSYLPLLWTPKRGYELIPVEDLPDYRDLTCAHYVSEIMDYWANGDEQSANITVKLVIGRFPGERELFDLVEPLMERKQTGLAEAVVSTLLDSCYSMARANYLMGKVLMQGFERAGGPEALLNEAEEHLERSVSLAPEDKYAQLALCDLFRMRQDPPAKVGDAYLRLLGDHPNFALAYNNFGLFCLLVEPTRAFQLFAKASKLEPMNPEYLVNQTRALMTAGRQVEAVDCLRRARALSPDHPMLLSLERQMRQAS